MVTIDDVNYENPFDMGVAVIHAYGTDGRRKHFNVEEVV